MPFMKIHCCNTIHFITLRNSVIKTLCLYMSLKGKLCFIKTGKDTRGTSFMTRFCTSLYCNTAKYITFNKNKIIQQLSDCLSEAPEREGNKRKIYNMCKNNSGIIARKVNIALFSSAAQASFAYIQVCLEPHGSILYTPVQNMTDRSVSNLPL